MITAYADMMKFPGLYCIHESCIIYTCYVALSGNASAALHLLKVAHPYPHGMETQRKPRKTAATYLAMKH